VEHCVGPLGVGTLIAKPKRHVLHVAELTDREAAEMGPLLRATACAVQDLTGAKPGLHVPLVAWRK
jgi:diadenosine tetraphosphate (Ap4A) HIT family hydrolase